MFTYISPCLLDKDRTSFLMNQPGAKGKQVIPSHFLRLITGFTFAMFFDLCLFPIIWQVQISSLRWSIFLEIVSWRLWMTKSHGTSLKITINNINSFIALCIKYNLPIKVESPSGTLSKGVSLKAEKTLKLDHQRGWCHGSLRVLGCSRKLVNG